MLSCQSFSFIWFSWVLKIFAFCEISVSRKGKYYFFFFFLQYFSEISGRITQTGSAEIKMLKSDDLEVYTKLCAHNCMMYLFSKHVLKMYLYMDKGEDGGK